MLIGIFGVKFLKKVIFISSWVCNFFLIKWKEINDIKCLELGFYFYG